MLTTYTDAKYLSSRRASRIPSDTATGAVKKAPANKYLASGLTASLTVASDVSNPPQKAGTIAASVAITIPTEKPSFSKAFPTEYAELSQGLTILSCVESYVGVAFFRFVI